jgi:phosphoenolpyruvate synthase/pyruvate phosphate dikinase
LKLAKIIQAGFPVPNGLCVTIEGYRAFVRSNGLDRKIIKEIQKKDIDAMRWEEIWDLSLAIKNFMIQTDIPKDLYDAIKEAVLALFGDAPVAVRSSSPEEDSEKTSFAGIHDSFLNIRGIEEIIKHIKMVWGSLFSTASIVYRKNRTGWLHDISIAVIIQRMIKSDRSGVVFTVNPMDRATGVIESVWGYNQGLVDGTVEPFKWILDRKTAEIDSSNRPKKIFMMKDPFSHEIIELKDGRVPLENGAVKEIFQDALKIEGLFNQATDIEWTMTENEFFFLQARPITTGKDLLDGDQKKDRELRPDLAKLSGIRKKIKNEILPGMQEDIRYAKGIDMQKITDDALIHEAKKLLKNYLRWKQSYWDYLIPFAHAIRMFGDFYNSKMAPASPHAYIGLLETDDLISVKRNARLLRFAELAQKDKDLYEIIQKHKSLKNSVYGKEFQDLMDEFKEDSSFGEAVTDANIMKIIGQYAQNFKKNTKVLVDQDHLKEKFIGNLKEAEKKLGIGLLDLAKEAYNLRDNDNILMGRLESPLKAAFSELQKRYQDLSVDQQKEYASSYQNFLENSMSMLQAKQRKKKPASLFARQLTGQPASSGTAEGKARVIHHQKDLFEIKASEIIVCDAIEPNMTFVIPAASAIIERRGGMLIHGAIIAREYKIPCITGVEDAMVFIKTGDYLHIDGDLGIITIERTRKVSHPS